MSRICSVIGLSASAQTSGHVESHRNLAVCGQIIPMTPSLDLGSASVKCSVKRQRTQTKRTQAQGRSAMLLTPSGSGF